METRSDRSLATAALALLACWAVPAVLLGLLQLGNDLQNWWYFHHPGERGAWVSLGRDTGLVPFLLLILGMNALLPALVIGVVRLVRAGRGVVPCLIYAVLVVGGPAALLLFSNAHNGDDVPFPPHLLSWYTLGGVADIGLAAAVMVGAWLLLSSSRPGPATAVSAPR